MSKYVVLESNEHPNDWTDTESIKQYKYPLDYFQKYAVRAMNRDANVMACVATGSGKSTLADYAIALSFSRGKRVIFTSPIKALSNQKYKEFKDAYGVSSVGLLTGDIKFNPDAPCIIMTAEILRNLLYKHKSDTQHLGITSDLSLKDVDTVVMDEVHYINNKDRGAVWEETLIMLPPEIKLVLLSATIDHPERIAEWVGALKRRPIHLIANTRRIIPLTHYIYKSQFYADLADDTVRRNSLIPIMNNDGAWIGRGYDTWSREFNKMMDVDLANSDPTSDAYQKQASKTYTSKNRLNNLVAYLQLCNLCPAICFVFSRKNCETYAASIEECLVSGKEAAEIESIFHFYTHAYRERLETLPQYFTLLNLLKKGIAYHHSGLVPVLKEIIEIIFSRGFIRVLFATETFSVGLNMPTKTVVFLELTKPDDGKGKRLIYTDEYLQMAGRAGRRGIDDRGVVIYCPMNKPERETDVRAILTGNKSIFTSKMSFGFDFIFKSMHSKDYHWVDIVKNSYWYLELQKHKQQLFRNCQEMRDKIEAIYDAIKEQSITIDELTERYDIETSIRVTPKERQRQIDSWKNRRIGRKWDVAYTQWKSIAGLQTQLGEMEIEYETCDDLEVFMGGYASYLVAIGFLQNIPEKFQDMNSTNLTHKGVLATEINEGNALLMPELYLYCVENMPEDPLELLCVLSLFMTGNNASSDTESPIKSPSNLIEFIHRRIEELRKELDVFNISVPEEQWTINESWYNIVYDWIEGCSVSEITEKYGIYEGNLTRGMLQLVNLLNEWRNMATYMGNIQMLSHIMDLESNIFRDIISPDSLYIRL